MVVKIACTIYCILMGLVAGIMAIILILAGVKFMTSDEESERAEAKKRIAMVFVAIMIIVSACPAITFLFGGAFGPCKTCENCGAFITGTWQMPTSLSSAGTGSGANPAGGSTSNPIDPRMPTSCTEACRSITDPPQPSCVVGDGCDSPLVTPVGDTGSLKAACKSAYETEDEMHCCCAQASSGDPIGPGSSGLVTGEAYRGALGGSSSQSATISISAAPISTCDSTVTSSSPTYCGIICITIAITNTGSEEHTYYYATNHMGHSRDITLSAGETRTRNDGWDYGNIIRIGRTGGRTLDGDLYSSLYEKLGPGSDARLVATSNTIQYDTNELLNNHCECRRTEGLEGC